MGDEAVATNTDGDDNCSEDKTPVEGLVLSKNQLKKLKRREKWLEIKQEKRKSEKQKRKQKLAERREKGEDVGPSRKKLKAHTMENSSCKIRVALDLSLDEYMNEKDGRSLVDQLRYCYSDNRRAANPLQLHLCGSSGKSMNRLEEIGDVKGWDVFVDKKPYDEAFPKDDIVYLSSESQNVLSTLSEDKVYVIGGLVDHNIHKGLCHRLAEEKGIAHAQLPIQDYFHMKTRKVLAVNHVFAILLKYTELNDWKESFLSIMPQRIQASLSEKKSDLSNGAQIKASETSEEQAGDIQAEKEHSKDLPKRCNISADAVSKSCEDSLSKDDKEPYSADSVDQQEQADSVKTDLGESLNVTQQKGQEKVVLLDGQNIGSNTQS